MTGCVKSEKSCIAISIVTEQMGNGGQAPIFCTQFSVRKGTVPDQDNPTENGAHSPNCPILLEEDLPEGIELGLQFTVEGKCVRLRIDPCAVCFDHPVRQIFDVNFFPVEE